MAYTAPNPLDRVAVDDNIFEFIPLGGNLYRVVPRPTSVIVPGTPINRELLKPLMDAVAAHDKEISTDIPQDIVNATEGNTNGWVQYPITTASFDTNGEYAIPLNINRFALYYGNVATVNSLTDKKYTYIEDILAIVDKNTQNVAGVYMSDNHLTGGSYSSLFGNSITVQRIWNDDNTGYLSIVLTASGLKITKTADFTSISFTLNILQI